MNKLLAITILLASTSVMAQTPEELSKAVHEEFVVLGVADDFVCGHHEVVMHVKKQDVKISKSSGITKLDEEALRATKAALNPAFSQWVQFSVIVDSGDCQTNFNYAPNIVNQQNGRFGR